MDRNQNVKHSLLWNMFWRNYDKLAIAARNGTPEDCEKLLKEGWKLDAKDKLGRTPLMIATKNPNIDVFRVLLKAGADINVVDDNGQGILEHALSNSKLEVVKEIVEKIKVQFNNFNEKEYQKYVKSYNIRNTSANNNNKFLASLIGSDLDNSFTPNEPIKIPYVFLAALNPDISVLDYLEENGCDLSIGMKDDINIFTQALKSNPNPEIIDYLIKKNLFINNPDLIYQLIIYNDSVDVWKRIFEIGIPKDNDLLYLLLAKKYNPNPDIVTLLADENSLKIKTDTFNPVLLAVEKSDTIYLKILKEAGADLNEKNDYGVSPLMSAVSYNPNIEITNYLIENGADIADYDNNGNNVLMYSVINPNLEIFKRFVELGADVHIKTKDEQENILFIALKNGANLEKVEYILSLGIDINEKSQRGYTAINYAANYNPYVEVLDYLIKKGADVNFAPDYDPNKNLLFNAAVNKNSDIVKYLIYKGLYVKARSRDGKTPLLVAATNSNLDVLYTLIQAGADINDVDNDHNNALLMAAAYNENYQLIPQLLRAGFSLDYRNNVGENAFILATKNRNLEVFQALMFNSRILFNNDNNYLNSSDIFGNTVLMHAIINDNVEIVKTLISKRVDINARTPEKITALICAVLKNSNPSIIDLLINAGADINAKDNNNNTIINYALRYSSLELVQHIEKITNTKFDDSNYNEYMKDPNNVHYVQACLDHLWSSNPNKKEEHLPYIFSAALNPDFRVLHYLREKGCNIFLGDFNANVIGYALSGNPNPYMVEYLFGNKINEDLYDLVLANIARNPKIEVWKKVFELGFPFDYQDDEGVSLLMLALGYERPIIELIKYLCNKKTVNLKDRLGFTASHYAAQKNDPIYLEILKANGALTNEKENVYGTTPLLGACLRDSSPSVIDFLINNGANINDRNIEGEDALLCAVQNKNPSIARHLIKEYNADIFTKDRYGRNILMEAIRARSEVLIKDFIELGIDVNEIDKNGYSSIVASAFFNPSTEILDLLIKNGADINFKTVKKENLLIFASRNNSNEQIIEYFLNKGFDKNYKTLDGETPLLAAAQNPNIKIIQKLVEKGANIKATNNSNLNALMIASQCNENPEVISYLIESGIPINSVDENGTTAVLLAAMNPKINIIDTLVNKGADLKSTNNFGLTSLMFAVSTNPNINMIKYLLEKGVDVNAKDANDRTALMHAAFKVTNPDVIYMLITAGADINAEDNSGYNAYRIAKENNPNPAVAETIKKYMTMASFKETSFNIPTKGDLN